MSNVFYTSDMHFSHRLLAIDVRGFQTIEEHDEAIIENWNKTVKKDDTVFVLGDVSLKKPAAYKHLTSRLNGSKHLIFGNHDSGNGANRDSNKYTVDYAMAGFTSTHDFLRRKIDGQQVMLSHYPYDGDHSDADRMEQYRLRDLGATLLHGHTHSEEVVSFSKNYTLQIHVGMDAHELFPVHMDEIVSLMSSFGV
jgi:calcineurin-like phosphoesterase family protein